MELEFVELYTDGSCLKSGIGGWGCILRQPSMNYSKELSGSEFPTTNNRMELMAMIKGLEALVEPCSVGVVTDSMYVCNGVMQGWARKWERQGWRHGVAYPVKNADLWERVLRLTETHQVKIQWVRGHDGHVENERCDFLATEASRLYVMDNKEEIKELIEEQRVDAVRQNSRRRTRAGY